VDPGSILQRSICYDRKAGVVNSCFLGLCCWSVQRVHKSLNPRKTCQNIFVMVLWKWQRNNVLSIPAKFVKDFLQQFLLLLFAKMRHNVPPNHKVLECCQLLDTCFTMVDCYEARSSWVCTNFCIFPSLIISLDFNIWNKQFPKAIRDFKKSPNYHQTWKGDIS
jgi:hypothetical protein